MSQVPYAMPLDDPTSVMGQRIGAYAIDFAVTLAVIFAVALPVFFSQVDRTPTARSNFCSTYNDEHSGGFCVVSGDTAYTLTSAKLNRLSRAFYTAYAGWTLLNAALLQGITGGTVGKLLVGLRVVRSDGQRAGIGRCVVRTILLMLVDSLCFVVGLVVSLSSTGHRRVGDMVASTLVVPKRYEGQSITVPGLTLAAGLRDRDQSPAAYGTAPPSPDSPTWDAARNAYIQYDRARSAWVQWNDQAKEWKPIE